MFVSGYFPSGHFPRGHFPNSTVVTIPVVVSSGSRSVGDDIWIGVPEIRRRPIVHIRELVLGTIPTPTAQVRIFLKTLAKSRGEAIISGHLGNFAVKNHPHFDSVPIFSKYSSYGTAKTSESAILLPFFEAIPLILVENGGILLIPSTFGASEEEKITLMPLAAGNIPIFSENHTVSVVHEAIHERICSAYAYRSFTEQHLFTDEEEIFDD